MNSKITAVLGDITAFLTIIAALPYELGNVADVFPPKVKTYVAIGGAAATVCLRLIKRVQTPDAATPVIVKNDNREPVPTQPQSGGEPEAILRELGKTPLKELINRAEAYHRSGPEQK